MIATLAAVALAVALECPEGTVPGWLDETGTPTSCVGDLPNPGGEPIEPTPEPTPEPEPEPTDAGIGTADSMVREDDGTVSHYTDGVKQPTKKKLAVTGADDVPWWLPPAGGAAILLGATLLMTSTKEED